MKKKSQLSRETTIRLAIGVVALVSSLVIYWQPTLGTAVDLTLLVIMSGLIFDFVWEGNKKLEEWKDREEDGSCSWRTTTDFFSHLEADIHVVDPSENCELRIYRGYDQGEDEQNWDLQKEVKDAIKKKRVDKFRKVNVVTTQSSISRAVDWVKDFAEDKELRDASRFYISFRKNPNVGSYVILGAKNCYIAFAGSEQKPSKTECGMFTQSVKIRQVIYDFIRALQFDCRDKTLIHGMELLLGTYLENGQLNKNRLVQDISARFALFNSRMSTSPEADLPMDKPEVCSHCGERLR